MSLNYTQIKEKTHQEVKTNDVSYPPEKMLSNVNDGIDSFHSIVFDVGGKWQYDDSNHNEYPILTTDIHAGQRDYSFTEDSEGNLLLEVHKVLVATEDGIFQELTPVDQQSDPGMDNFWDGYDATGVPYRYDKTANGIFLDPIPDYQANGG